MADQKNLSAAAPAAAQKKTLTADEFGKLTLEQKQKIRQDGKHELTAEQLDNIETEEELQYHRDMLKKQTLQRMPRILQGLKTIADLSSHNPNEAQKAAILKSLDEAMQKIRDAFAGKLATGFQFPE